MGGRLRRALDFGGRVLIFGLRIALPDLRARFFLFWGLVRLSLALGLSKLLLILEFRGGSRNESMRLGLAGDGVWRG